MDTTTIVGLLQPQTLLQDPKFLALFILLLVWSIIWKGLALWKAARLSNKWWFLVLLVVNTLGILEIIYIYFVAKKYTVETVEQA